MKHNREFLGFDRIGTEPQRSYYVPFSDKDVPETVYGITDRNSSSEFTSLDGVWKIRQYENIEAVDITVCPESEIEVPLSVQMAGYDRIQYINCRYPFPVMPPYTPADTPCWHYRKLFCLNKCGDRKYYLVFEGVDSAFYLFVNGKFKGYSQISHSQSEFDVTEFVKSGENTVDVIVLKWCAGSYLECQDKFRMSGIFRSVYILDRPEKHIGDYKTETAFSGGQWSLSIENRGKIGFSANFMGQRKFVSPRSREIFTAISAEKWSAENPALYDLVLTANGERVYEKIGFRTICIENGVFKINGEKVKFKGVNRHEFNGKTGAAVSLYDTVKDLDMMKELNVNAVRTSHYPDMPEFYALCDAKGVFVLNEADLEMHGACTRHGDYENGLWQEYADDLLFEKGIYEREVALVERDKNRPCVVMWSLGNESSFGKAFLKGAKYVKRADTRPVFYEGLQNAAKKYYYSRYIEVCGGMYLGTEWLKKNVIDNPKEKRPFLLCEFSHAMGNSNGDLAEYFKVFDSFDNLAGGFIWEWADHAIITDDGIKYGGDFGETEHDGNFCVDGLVTVDRKLKPGALEMRAVYGGKRETFPKDVRIPENDGCCEKIIVEYDDKSGAINQIYADGISVLRSPVRINALRFIDNDRFVAQNYWDKIYKLKNLKQIAVEKTYKSDGAEFSVALCSDCLNPAAYIKLGYKTDKNKLIIDFSYEIADYIKCLPRMGLEFELSDKYAAFSYVGYGESESYVDKNLAAEDGFYQSDAFKNFTDYLKPQETGSHYNARYLCVENLFSLTAEKPFSFSVLPYDTGTLVNTAHSYELKRNDTVNVCIDLFMRGIGSASCGEELKKEYEIPRKGKNVFTFVF